MMSGPHILYRCFDATGGLLYVGITGDPGSRFAVHRCTTPWWPDVSKITEEECASRAELEEAERRAIREECPFYNLKDNPHHPCPTCWSPSPHFFPARPIHGAVTVVLEGQEPFVTCTDPFHCTTVEDRSRQELIHANRDQLIETGVLIPAPKMPIPTEWQAFSDLFTRAGGA